MPATKKTVKKTTTKTTVKKAAVKKAEAATADCECASEKKCKKTQTAKKTTRVIAKYNAGWGNQLFIRGLGGGLDWNVGVPMQCIGEDEWLWEQAVSKGNISFKILVNDNQWSEGDDFVVAAGDTTICHPKF